jgi:hypothetical protein
MALIDKIKILSRYFLKIRFSKLFQNSKFEKGFYKEY